MDNKGEMKVQMEAKGIITYPDGSVKEITFKTNSVPVDKVLALKEKKEDGNSTSSGD